MFLFLDYYLENLGYILIDHRSNIDFFVVLTLRLWIIIYLVDTLEIYLVDTLEIYLVDTLEIYLVDTLERFTRHPATLFNIINTMRHELSYQ